MGRVGGQHRAHIGAAVQGRTGPDFRRVASKAAPFPSGQHVGNGHAHSDHSPQAGLRFIVLLHQDVLRNDGFHAPTFSPQAERSDPKRTRQCRAPISSEIGRTLTNIARPVYAGVTERRLGHSILGRNQVTTPTSGRKPQITKTWCNPMLSASAPRIAAATPPTAKFRP